MSSNRIWSPHSVNDWVGGAIAARPADEVFQLALQTLFAEHFKNERAAGLVPDGEGFPGTFHFFGFP